MPVCPPGSDLTRRSAPPESGARGEGGRAWGAPASDGPAGAGAGRWPEL